MTTQQVVALFIICAFVIGLFTYAYFLGRKAGRAHRQPGLLLDSAPRPGHNSFSVQASPQISTPKGSGYAVARAIRDAIPASLRDARSIDAQKTKSLCCKAAGIIQPLISPAEALIPHDKLREAALADATLIARDRPHAQPAEGYTHTPAVSCIVAAMDVTLAGQAGTYATSEHMALAIEAALLQAGFLSPADESWQVMRARLDELLISREAEQCGHHRTIANLKRTIIEFEQRTPSHTGVPVTRSDYSFLMQTIETLRLAERTMTALKSQVAKQAGEQAISLEALAKRVHAQLRRTTAITDGTEEAHEHARASMAHN
ncbi:hypothetical protein [Pseudomonas sp. NPDC088890]|uniref:hypothetical protein n=1 Tax=Pseudomonas sp. NPDC088890 TaxID=3364458 RepID=UPI00384F6037